MIASVEYSRVITPPGWSSTVQTLRQVCYNQLGCGVGALAGGWWVAEVEVHAGAQKADTQMCRVMFYFGSRCLYWWSSVLTLFFFVAHGALALGGAGGGGQLVT